MTLVHDPREEHRSQSALALQRLLPPECVCAVCTIRPDAAPLFPEEEALMDDAPSGRRAEFAAGRHAAREALNALGYPPGPILRDSHRAPVWPPGIVGSITHVENFAAAAVVSADDCHALGIDVERCSEVHRELWLDLFVPAELRYLASLPINVQTPMAAALFSLKEAFFKFQHPLTLQWLDFSDVEVEIVDYTTARITPGSRGGRVLARLPHHQIRFGFSSRFALATVWASHRPAGPG